jgi:hypothetical protein
MSNVLGLVRNSLYKDNILASMFDGALYIWNITCIDKSHYGKRKMKGVDRVLFLLYVRLFHNNLIMYYTRVLL